jgi:hypothetical protein
MCIPLLQTAVGRWPSQVESSTCSHTDTPDACLLSRSGIRGEDLLLLVKAPITEPAKMRTPPAVHVLALVTDVANDHGGRTLTAKLAPGSMCGMRACRPEALLSAGSTWHALTVAQLTTHMRWAQSSAAGIWPWPWAWHHPVPLCCCMMLAAWLRQ